MAEWMQIRITLADANAAPAGMVERICNLLVVAGAETFSVEDYSDLEETLSQGGVFYDYIDDSLLEAKGKIPVINAYLPANEQGKEIYACLTEALADLRAREDGYSSLSVTLSGVRDEDWENSWKQYFKPFPVGEKLLVKPSWETADEELLRGRTVIEIDPSSSFGSGTHATTHLCLLALENTVKPGDSVLDMGCGSGILGIASLLLGASSLRMVDIDQNAARIAGENIRANRLEHTDFRVLCGDVGNDSALCEQIGSGFDIICANIVAGIIIEMSSLLYGKLKPGGSFIASGIITERAAEVSAALERAGFFIRETRELDGWVMLLCTRPETEIL